MGKYFILIITYSNKKIKIRTSTCIPDSLLHFNNTVIL